MPSRGNNLWGKSLCKQTSPKHFLASGARQKQSQSKHKPQTSHIISHRGGHGAKALQGIAPMKSWCLFVSRRIQSNTTMSRMIHCAHCSNYLWVVQNMEGIQIEQSLQLSCSSMTTVVSVWRQTNTKISCDLGSLLHGAYQQLSSISCCWEH